MNDNLEPLEAGENDMSINTVLDRGEFYNELTQAINRVATMRLQQANATDVKSPFEDALHTLQKQLEALQATSESERSRNESLVEATEDATGESLRYRQLFETVPPPYITTNVHGEILEANRYAYEAFNLNIDNLKSKPLITCIVKSDRQIFRQALVRLKTKNALFVASLSFQCKGTEVPVEHSARVIPSVTIEPEEREIHWLLTPVIAPVKIWEGRNGGDSDKFSEILEVHPPEGNVETSSRELKALRGYAVSHTNLSTVHEVTSLLDSTVLEIANLIGDHCFLSVLSPERTHLIPMAAATKKEENASIIKRFLQAEAVPVAENFASEVITTQLPCNITNTTASKTPLDQIFNGRAVNLLMIPLRAGKTSVGLLTILRDNTEDSYEDFEVTIVQNLADHVGLILRYLDTVPTDLQSNAAHVLHAAFLGDVCVELQASLHALDGYADMLKEQAQELGLPDLEHDVTFICDAAAHSNRVLSDTFELAQIDIGVRRPAVEPISVTLFIGELVSVIRHLPNVKDVAVGEFSNNEVVTIEADTAWAGQIVRKVMGSLSWSSAKIKVASEQNSTSVSLVVQCNDGLFTHRYTGARPASSESMSYKRRIAQLLTKGWQ